MRMMMMMNDIGLVDPLKQQQQQQQQQQHATD